METLEVPDWFSELDFGDDDVAPTKAKAVGVQPVCYHYYPAAPLGRPPRPGSYTVKALRDRFDACSHMRDRVQVCSSPLSDFDFTLKDTRRGLPFASGYIDLVEGYTFNFESPRGGLRSVFDVKDPVRVVSDEMDGLLRPYRPPPPPKPTVPKRRPAPRKRTAPAPRKRVRKTAPASAKRARTRKKGGVKQ